MSRSNTLGTLPLLLLGAVFIGMLLLFFWPTNEPQLADDLVGKNIARLAVYDLHGNAMSYTPAKGEVTVLNLWAPWCGPCREEMPSLQRLSNKLPDDLFKVVGIAMEADDHLVREFLAERNISFYNVLDASGEVISDQLKIQVLPSTLIIDPQGVVVEVVYGEREWDAPEWLNVIEKTALSQ